MNAATSTAGGIERSVAHEIAARTDTVLERVMRARSGELFAAQLLHHALDVELDAIPTHVIAYHIDGSTDVEKRVRGRVKGRHPRIGSLTLIPGGIETGWRIGGANRVAHLYVPQQHLDAYCREDIGIDRKPEVVDFFGVNDAWLGAFFTLLLTEDETGGAAGGEVESLLLDQLRHRLVRHLVENYTTVGRPRAATGAGSDMARLRPGTLRRVFELIDSRLSQDIRLKELAAVACQSVDHFSRSFRDTVGCTPYQYVLRRRVECAKGLLRDTDLQIAAVCERVGFNSVCHFSVAFRRSVGTSPRRFRSER
jgi:AraC family transcriptional regulator